MPTIRLTEPAIAKALRDAAGSRLEVADATCPGLRLRIGAGGSATWLLGCRDVAGAARRFVLGRYPALGIAAARKAAKAERERVRGGADPIAERRAKRADAARDGMDTLRGLVAIYADKVGRDLKSWPEYEARIVSVFGKVIDRPLTDLTRASLQITADAWSAKQSAALAVRCLRPVLKWAAQRDLVPPDLAGIVPPATVGRRERVLSREELARLLPVLRANETPYGACLRFLLLTLARRSEAAGATWRHIDWQTGTWTIPETKNGRPHVVPLSRQAVALLRERMPAEPDPDAPIFATRTGRVLESWDKATKAIQRASTTEGWHRHDLRRTGATLLGEMATPPHIIEAALNHAAIHSTLAATYNRARYGADVADALQRLADLLDNIETGGASVVPLRSS